ncbi:MAG: ComEC/Rec2 family competence protein [Polaribacter sp.]|nr:ComEC/Rec2 family competence protein [Polaribacter sp.]
MKKLLKFLPTHFTICLIVGIALQFHYQVWQLPFVQSIIVLLLSVIILIVLKALRRQGLFTLFSWVFFFFLGMFSVFIQNATNYNNHYARFLKEHKEAVFVVGKVLKPNRYYNKYLGSVVKVGTTKTRGKILLHIQKDSAVNSLKIHDKIMIAADFVEVPAVLNPHQFDYKKYLEKQGVYQQVFIKNKPFVRISNPHFSIYKLADDVRSAIQKSLKKHHFKEEELAVVSALLLGQRQDISKELITDYTRAGAIHILAVSGLHVGIILLILSFVLKPLERFRNGKLLKTILIVCLLWVFAVIAGLSASVVRAVTMFTAVAIAMTFDRKTMVTHSLIASMFILLLFKPMFLFEVGFQLSYLAVFSIVWIQPKLYVLWKPTWKLVDYFWQLFTVSTAAQLGVLPISLFYFHQFPGLFMLSNLVIIPFIGSILIGGIVVIVLSLLKILPLFVANAYGAVILAMNAFVGWISKQESFLIEEISFSFLLLIITYGCFVVGVQFLTKRTYKNSLLTLGIVLVFQLGLLYEKRQVSIKNELVVFHKSRQTLLVKRTGNRIKVYHDLDSLKILRSSALKSYTTGEKIESVVYKLGFPAVLKLQHTKLLLIDSLGVYKLPALQNCVVLLCQSPKINLERLLKTIHPKEVIADGSNYKSQIQHWRAICEKHQIPFHDTGTDGAKMLK